MIREAHGNLLAADVDALVNTVNTVGVMGKGIALQFKRAYPQMFKEYSRRAKAGELRPGQVMIWETGSLDGPRFVINFPTKRHWRGPSRLEDIEAGLSDLIVQTQAYGIRSLAVPPLGCGNGGLDWADVLPRMLSAFATLDPDIDVVIYPPEGAPAAADVIERRARPGMTAGRAALLTMMRQYVGISAHAPSQIELQKLMYFLQVVEGESLRLKYVANYYGPYADNLRHVLQDLEGHYISGFGDGSAKVNESEPLQLKNERDESEIVAALPRQTKDRTVEVLRIISGYESPYGLELLSTVHWVIAHNRGAKDDSLVAIEAVHGWNQRKNSMFTARHIEIAWRALHDRLTDSELEAVPAI